MPDSIQEQKAQSLKAEELLQNHSAGYNAEKAAYKHFCKANAYWLDEYAEFCAQRDANEPDYWRWIQWQLDKQFADEAKYARSKGVHFKGDLPIGVGRDSVDAASYPQLYNLDSSAGAPPDFFSAAISFLISRRLEEVVPSS